MGHTGQLVIGELESQPVLAMQGRIHYYEGYTMQQVTLPVQGDAAVGNRNPDRNKCCRSHSSGFYSRRCDVDHRQPESDWDVWPESA